MDARRKLSRRSFLATVAGGAAGIGGAVVLIGGGEAKALQVTDNDPGDPTNGGRRIRSGCSDSDNGQGSDPSGWGRSCRPPTGHTDNDPGDPTNGGRGPQGGRPVTGVTDNDPGDPTNGGRRVRSGCSDSDSGQGGDPGGWGRRCR